MDWGLAFGYALIVFWSVKTFTHFSKLEKELKLAGHEYQSGGNVFLLFALLPWFIRKAEREWMDEQKRVREGSEQLCEGGDEGVNVPNWVGCSCFSCTDGWPTWLRQLPDDDFRRLAPAFASRVDAGGSN